MFSIKDTPPDNYTPSTDLIPQDELINPGSYLVDLLEEYDGVMQEQVLRRKTLIQLGQYIAFHNMRPYLGHANQYYIGPDVDNKTWIFVLGAKANHPITQMETLGHRTRVRSPRINKATRVTTKRKPA